VLREALVNAAGEKANDGQVLQQYTFLFDGKRRG
jgi:hypothetical protein